MAEPAAVHSLSDLLTVAAPYAGLVATGIASYVAASARKLVSRIENLEARAADHDAKLREDGVRRQLVGQMRDGEFARLNERLARQDEVLDKLGAKMDTLQSTVVPRTLCEALHRHLESEIRGDHFDGLGGAKGHGSE